MLFYPKGGINHERTLRWQHRDTIRKTTQKRNNNSARNKRNYTDARIHREKNRYHNKIKWLNKSGNNNDGEQ